MVRVNSKNENEIVKNIKKLGTDSMQDKENKIIGFEARGYGRY